MRAHTRQLKDFTFIKLKTEKEMYPVIPGLTRNPRFMKPISFASYLPSITSLKRRGEDTPTYVRITENNFSNLQSLIFLLYLSPGFPLEIAQKVKISIKLPISVILSVAKNLDRTAVKRFFASLRMTAMIIFLDFLRSLAFAGMTESFLTIIKNS